MFYEPKDGHGLTKNPFNSLVIPRPIGWISSIDGQGNASTFEERQAPVDAVQHGEGTAWRGEIRHRKSPTEGRGILCMVGGIGRAVDGDLARDTEPVRPPLLGEL